MKKYNAIISEAEKNMKRLCQGNEKKNMRKKFKKNNRKLLKVIIHKKI